MIKSLKTASLLLSGLLTSALVFGQADQPKRKNQFKFSPARVFDLVNPGIEFSFEKLHSRTSSQISIAWMRDIFNTTPFEQYKGWRFSLEEKFFISQKKKRRTYLGIDLVYLNVDYAYKSSFHTRDTANPVYFTDTFNVARQTIALNFKKGVQFYLRSFVIEIYGGIGIKYKIVDRSGINDPSTVEQNPIHPNAYYMANKEGDRFAINVPLGVRIGFAF